MVSMKSNERMTRNFGMKLSLQLLTSPPQIRAGRARALAPTSIKHGHHALDIPTVQESGAEAG